VRAKSSSSVPTTCRTTCRHERRRAGAPTAPYLLGSSKTHGRLRCPLPRPPFRQQVAGAVDRRLTVLATHHWIPSQRRRLAAQTFRVEQEHRTAARCSVLDYVELRARRDHRVGEVLDHSLRRIVLPPPRRPQDDLVVLQLRHDPGLWSRALSLVSKQHADLMYRCLLVVLNTPPRPLGQLTNNTGAEVRVDVDATRPAFVLVALSRARAETVEPDSRGTFLGQ
jgi:hypothetical protein